jgi:hypothetical protein
MNLPPDIANRLRKIEAIAARPGTPGDAVEARDAIENLGRAISSYDKNKVIAQIDDVRGQRNAHPGNQPEIVLLTKVGGPLTKQIRLDQDGRIESDGSACVMSRGTAHRTPVSDIEQLGALIGMVRSDQAIALGSLRAGLPHEVEIATKRAINGDARPGIISRTADNIVFRPGQQGFVLLDYDTKGMPSEVAERLDREGGFWPAIISLMPGLASIARVSRASTSAGLYRKDTDVAVPGSNGLHVYLAVKDVADSARFLKTLHDRCWLAGLGWFVVGAGGQLLERSIIDRMVGGPERLVFEGAPILVERLAQSAEARLPDITDGDWLDTLAECPPLSVLEKARLQELRTKAAHRLAGDSAKAREGFIDKQANELAKQSGISARAAREAIRQQCSGLLLPSIALPFDDPELAGKTVADVLADPEGFEGETLADPLEGVEYGRCKARIMRRADGTPWIHSFAHGRTRYELKRDSTAIRAAMTAADSSEVVAIFVELLLQAPIEPADEEILIAYAKERSGVSLRTIKGQIKKARQAREEEQAEEERQRWMAERDDPRPMLPAPAYDAPWVPQMDAVNSVLCKSNDRIPPCRNIDGDTACVRRTEIPGTHAFVSANEESDITGQAPPQWTIRTMSEAETAEMIERYIDFVDKNNRSVHLATSFVRHFMRRDDDVLPTLAAVASLPIISADGAMIYADGLDRDRGIVFNVEPALMKILPSRQYCDRIAVGNAMRYLLDEWLADVATDHAGKCTLIALALTIIERPLLDQRPTWFVTAGRRGSGKTTALQMVIEAVTGSAASASAWSSNEEERRKALLGYLMSGVSYILWDNISRGAQISCPHIEKSCTAARYSDRKLGVSELVQTAATTVHCFTGNNINPKGDLASRSLQVRLDVDRVDPENRDFKHPDPIAWTRTHRNEILRALYVVLFGNPALGLPREAAMKTRFKMWYRVVGRAVEHAAWCAALIDPDTDHVPDHVLDFSALFLDQEAGDEDETSLSEALHALDEVMADHDVALGRPKQPFKAAEVADLINATLADANALTVRGFLFPTLQSGAQVTAKAVSKQLKAHMSEPVRRGERTIVLKEEMDKHDKIMRFHLASIA